MKKIFLLVIAIVLIVSLSVVGLMGCQGSTSLTQIFSEENIWKEASFPETFTYSMYKDGETTSMGTLTMTVVELEPNKTYYLGKTGDVDESEKIYSAKAASVRPTYKATTTLVAGTYTQTSIAYFTDNFRMLMTYSSVVEDGKETSYIARNEDNKKYYYRTNANWNEELSIKNGKYESSPYYDNTMIYYVARTMPNDSTYSSFSFNIFNHDTNKKEAVSLTNPVNSGDTLEIGSATFNVKKITMTTTDKLLGTTNKLECYINQAKKNKSKNVILQIKEGQYKYVLDIPSV